LLLAGLASVATASLLLLLLLLLLLVLLLLLSPPPGVAHGKEDTEPVESEACFFNPTVEKNEEDVVEMHEL
jgi:hypothetical protein